MYLSFYQMLNLPTAEAKALQQLTSEIITETSLPVFLHLLCLLSCITMKTLSFSSVSLSYSKINSDKG